jgi:hypothetical protein
MAGGRRGTPAQGSLGDATDSGTIASAKPAAGNTGAREKKRVIPMIMVACGLVLPVRPHASTGSTASKRRLARTALALAAILGLNGAAIADDVPAAPKYEQETPARSPDEPVPADGWARDPDAVLLAQASVVNPAQAQSDAQPTAAGDQPAQSGRRLGSWEMPAVIVEGRRISPYREDDLIGSYEQPRWTAHRRFAGTRIYVRPAGQFDFEQWFRWKDKKDDPDVLVTQSELEFGLGHRLQLDYYLITRKTDGESTKVDNAIELRYAFADWGRIWGNPTVYLEWISQDSDPDVVETKLLLGGDIAPGWHWGTNLVWEQETGGSRESVYEFTAGLSQTLSDQKFSWGLETKLEWADEEGSRGDYSKDLRLGPSFQWRPVAQMHIDFAPLFGLTSDSLRSDVYLIFGYEF